MRLSPIASATFLTKGASELGMPTINDFFVGEHIGNRIFGVAADWHNFWCILITIALARSPADTHMNILSVFHVVPVGHGPS